jgi:hypothetical protein
MGVLLEGYDQLVDKLQTITGLRVFDDPRNINPPCVLVEAPTFIMQSNVIAELQFNVKLIGLGPGNYTGTQKPIRPSRPNTGRQNRVKRRAAYRNHSRGPRL